MQNLKISNAGQRCGVTYQPIKLRDPLRFLFESEISWEVFLIKLQVIHRLQIELLTYISDLPSISLSSRARVNILGVINTMLRGSKFQLEVRYTSIDIASYYDTGIRDTLFSDSRKTNGIIIGESIRAI